MLVRSLQNSKKKHFKCRKIPHFNFQPVLIHEDFERSIIQIADLETQLSWSYPHIAHFSHFRMLLKVLDSIENKYRYN